MRILELERFHLDWTIFGKVSSVAVEEGSLFCR